MNDFQYFYWLTGQATSGLLFFWYVSLPLTLVAMWAVLRLFHNRPLARSTVVALIVGSLAPVGFLAIGALLKADPGTISKTNAYIALALLLFIFSIFVACVAYARGQRVAVSAFLLAASWPLLMTYFVAGMSMTGDWL